MSVFRFVYWNARPRSSKEGVGSPGAIAVCEPPDVGAGNKTRVLRSNSMHLPQPYKIYFGQNEECKHGHLTLRMFPITPDILTLSDTHTPSTV